MLLPVCLYGKLRLIFPNALTPLHALPVRSSLDGCVTMIWPLPVLLSAATTTLLQATTAVQNAYNKKNKCHLFQKPGQNYFETTQKTFSSLSQQPQGHCRVGQYSSQQSTANNCCLHPKVRLNKKQCCCILRFWIHFFCILNFKQPQQIDTVLPENCTTFFGTCCHLIF